MDGKQIEVSRDDNGNAIGDPVMALESIDGLVKVEWVNMGEGWEGDYDETNPEDANLLRFDVSFRESKNDEWIAAEDGSYVTRLTAGTSDSDLLAGLIEIISSIDGNSADWFYNRSHKRICERLSWLSRDSIRQLAPLLAEAA